MRIKRLLSILLCLAVCLCAVPMITSAATVTGNDHITFSSSAAFKIYAVQKGWNGTLQYSTNNSNWSTWDGGEISAAQSGGVYYLCIRGTGNTKITGSEAYRWKLTATSGVSCDGNIMTLLNYSNPSAATMDARCFAWLFDGWAKLTKAPSLPATTLAADCYSAMFYNCEGLTTAPALPAMTMVDGCYNSMFYGCNGLTAAPSLPATKLDRYCYSRMFYACHGLTTTPSLPAMTMADHCYSEMFENCRGLKTAKPLPATNLYQSCYFKMFFNCPVLTTAPTLPATTMKWSCYEAMFQNCTALVTAPTLPATTLDSTCYSCMFEGCSALQNAPALPATSVPLMAYNRMFANCTTLTTAPALPAVTLAPACYQQMFLNCYKLAAAPQLPAVNLEKTCYREMFRNCADLKLYKIGKGATWSIPANAVTAERFNEDMFKGAGGTVDASPAIGAVYYAQQAEGYNIWVAGVPVTAENRYDVLNDGGSVKFVPNGVVYGDEYPIGETLIFDNAKITAPCGIYSAADGRSAVVYIDRNISVYLIGDSTIKATAQNDMDGIRVAEDCYVRIYGSGSMDIAVSKNGGRALSASDSTVSTWENVRLKLSGHYGYYATYTGYEVPWLDLYGDSQITAYGLRADDGTDGNAVYCGEIEVNDNALFYAEYDQNNAAVDSWGTDFRYTDLITVSGIKIRPGMINRTWETLPSINAGGGTPNEEDYRALKVLAQGNRPGDVNKDGNINSRDVISLKWAILRDLTLPQYDVNKDTAVDVRDLVKLKKILA
ncbi:MAG: dockerin type I repeat-containing protein [Clostridia bacterium]|nr:dockerin type I repeat-containing protein [Clostridia bacterium]